MKHIQTYTIYTESVVVIKNDDEEESMQRDFKKLMKKVVFEFKTKGFFGKKCEVSVWYMPFKDKIYEIESDRKIDFPFSKGDHIEKVFNFIEENDGVITAQRRRIRGKNSD